MKTGAQRTASASATLLLMQTYFVSTSALATIASGRAHQAGALCAPSTPAFGPCCLISQRPSSSVVMSWSRKRKRHPAVAFGHALLQRGSPFCQRGTSDAEHSSSRSSASVRVNGAVDDSASAFPAFPSERIGVAAAAPAAPATGASARPSLLTPATDAAQSPSGGVAAGASPPFSLEWGSEKLQKLRRYVFELPEDTAEESRFLIMAALVGVITGTAGMSSLSHGEERRLCFVMILHVARVD